MARPARLSREKVVDAALTRVERDGVDALTMRALARDLRVDPMAVYRHVADKDDLLGALCDRVLAELPALRPDDPWEPQVLELARELRDRLIAHPGLVGVLTSAPATPASVLVARDAVALLAGHGFPPGAAASAFATVFAFVLGHVQLEAAPPPGIDEDGLRAAAAERLGADDAPMLDDALALMAGPADFEAGLDLVLAGVRAGAVEHPGAS